MSAQLIDGKAIADGIKREVRASDGRPGGRGLRPPGLAVVMVGEIGGLRRSMCATSAAACEEAGIVSSAHDLPASTTGEPNCWR